MSAAAAGGGGAGGGPGPGPGPGPGRGRRRGGSPARRRGGSRRRRALRSLGSLAGRLLRTWARLASARRARRAAAEDDEGGFGRAEPPAAPGSPRRRQAAAAAARGRGELEPGPRRGAAEAAAGAGAGTGTGTGAGRPPGAQGLRNHGNTCFMNAVVQCLSNTAPLAELLALGRYRARGARAEVTHRLAALVRALWTLDYTPQLSAEFKSIVSEHGAQFRGNAQHDALEFLLWLLDRLHEDLGSGSPAPQPRRHDKPGPDESGDAGSAPPAARPPRGPSFVQSHFQAQYRSSLTCPHCRKQSNTFDPFLCVSLPIPPRQTRPLNVTLVFQCKSQRFVRVGLAVPLLSTVARLREMVAAEGRIPPEQVILAEVCPAGFRRSFSDEEQLSAIAEGASVYAFQPPLPLGRGGSLRLAGCPLSLPSSPNAAEPEGQRLPPAALSSECLHRGAGGRVLLLLCNTAGAGPQATRFGPPLVMREDRGISWEQLQQCILAKMRYLMRSEVQPQGAGALFRIRVAGGSVACSYLSPQDARPLCHPAVDRALQLGGPGGPPHVKLTVEWDAGTKERLFGSIQEEVVQDAESVRLQQQAHQQQHSCTLDECFQLYTKEEQLAPDDAWRCPHCKVLQQGMVKLSLWTLPDILIIHLKRFRQVAEHRHKLTTLVQFPLRGLDMAPHVAQRGQAPSKQAPGHWAPWKAPLCLPESCQLDYLYDLYAVCNHHGSMQGGHYTAYCCNSLDGRWYSYDDSTVEGVQEDEVSTRSAYILFYQRRNAIPAWSASSSVRGSTSSSLSDHWVSRLGGQRESGASRGSAACPSLPGAPDSPGFPDAAGSLKKGGFEARPPVRGLQRRSVSMKLSPAKAEAGAAARPPPRWSFASRERGASGELVAYLESGRRPRFTHAAILPQAPGDGAGALGTPEGTELLHGGLRPPPSTPTAAGLPGRAGEPARGTPPGGSEATGPGGRPGRQGPVALPHGRPQLQAERLSPCSGGATAAARAERSLRRSASLGPGGEGPPARRPPGGPPPRPRYHSASLGRRKAVPESSF